MIFVSIFLALSFLAVLLYPAYKIQKKMGVYSIITNIILIIVILIAFLLSVEYVWKH
jgi:hypothetical protein